MLSAVRLILAFLAISSPILMGVGKAVARVARQGVAKVETIDLPEKMGKLPQGYLDAPSRLLAAQPCDYERSWHVEDRTYAGLVLDAPSISCNVWPSKDRAQLVFSSKTIIGGEVLPIVAYLPANLLKHSAIRRLVVYVIGGPGGDVAPGLNDHLPSRLATSGDVVVKIGYSGTRYGSRYPKPDFDVAVSQVRSYVYRLRALNPSAQIVLLGESLGGQIAVKAATEPSLKRVISAIILIHPLAFSPDKALKNFKNLADTGHHKDPELQVRQVGEKRSVPGQYVNIKSQDLFGSFFAPREKAVGLDAYLDGVRGVKVLIAYGDTDKKTGVDQIRELASKENRITLLALPNTSHVVEEAHAEQISLAISHWR